VFGTHGRAKLTPQLGCLAGLTNPLELIAGTTWGFRAQDFVAGSVGIFTASISAGSGVLAVSETETFATGNVVRLAQGAGRYQVYSDCSGGELLFNIGGIATQYEFVFVDGGNEMFMVSDSLIDNAAANGFNENYGGAMKQ
jgi:hypothetical protein